MDATLIVIDSDAELARARALVDQLWRSDDPADIARLEAQARLIAAYEDNKWPRRPHIAAPAPAKRLSSVYPRRGRSIRRG